MSNLSLITRKCRDCDGVLGEGVPLRGPYANLCEICKPVHVAQLQIARDENTIKKPNNGINLPKTVKDAVKAAYRLQKAVEQRRMSQKEEQLALLDFQAAMRRINDNAQKLLNNVQSPRYDDDGR